MAGYLMQSFCRVVRYTKVSLKKIHIWAFTHTLTHDALRNVLIFSQNSPLTEISITFEMYPLTTVGTTIWWPLWHGLTPSAPSSLA